MLTSLRFRAMSESLLGMVVASSGTGIAVADGQLQNILTGVAVAAGGITFVLRGVWRISGERALALYKIEEQTKTHIKMEESLKELAMSINNLSVHQSEICIRLSKLESIQGVKPARGHA